MSQSNADLIANVSSHLAIITRPAPEGELLTTQLNLAGISASYLPLFDIEAGADLPKLQSVLNNLLPDDIVIIVSPQVSHIIESYQPTTYFPPTVHYYAVGKKSATLFNEMTGLTASYPEQESSEGLLDLLQKRESLLNRKVLILRGESGRDLLGATLTKQQAKVDYLACYIKKQINYDPAILTSEQTRKLIIVITSTAHLLQFEKICPLMVKKEAQLIVSSERILVQAKQLNWQHIHLATSANNKILFKTITTLCHNGSIMTKDNLNPTY
ncbi:uroporphyrinogen-III synthase [Orbaceae bacterium ESL0721]|nr:uroporphyrinogen-III synthase [Orbaceae bacterium ESL0721]